jgi:MarR family transcriptional regulator, organic hydroperoxide resistance regulator
VRERSQSDRRVVRIRATERGVAIAAGVPVTAMELFSGALRALSPEDRSELRRILLDLAEKVREQVEDAESSGEAT